MKFEEIKKYVLLDKWVDGTWCCSGARNDIFVTGNVNITDFDGSKLPFSFGSISGDFKCQDTNIETLEGFPNIVKGNYCLSRNKISNLKNLPYKINGHFWLEEPLLQKVHRIPKYVTGHFYYQIFEGQEELYDDIMLKFSQFRIGGIGGQHYNLKDNADFGWGGENKGRAMVKHIVSNAPHCVGRSRIDGSHLSMIEIQ